jgi:hypothetical protein
MSIKYTVSQSLAGVEIVTANLGNGVILSIPADPANSDYQRYLAWLENPNAEQSTPIVVDEAETI